jgi:hypothetical protein
MKVVFTSALPWRVFFQTCPSFFGEKTLDDKTERRKKFANGPHGRTRPGADSPKQQQQQHCAAFKRTPNPIYLSYSNLS